MFLLKLNFCIWQHFHWSVTLSVRGEEAYKENLMGYWVIEKWNISERCQNTQIHLGPSPRISAVQLRGTSTLTRFPWTRQQSRWNKTPYLGELLWRKWDLAWTTIHHSRVHLILFVAFTLIIILVKGPAYNVHCLSKLSHAVWAPWEARSGSGVGPPAFQT